MAVMNVAASSAAAAAAAVADGNWSADKAEYLTRPKPGRIFLSYFRLDLANGQHSYLYT